MRMVDLIMKTRHGEPLSKNEIEAIVSGFTSGKIPDYQMSAWMMAVCLKGMGAKQTAELTMAMMNSGDTVDLSDLNGIKVDKHSTGGVGDSTTLIAAPLVAACGGTVAKLSGRGLGHTGGTLDKLESVPGVNIELSMERFKEIVSQIGVCVMGQTGNFVPADKLMYALRDVTGTVEGIPLIASSVMSKKLASGSDAIVLDVKAGSGAFMHTPEDAETLARTMVDIGNRMGRRTMALITDMNQPLGLAVGNALEIIEVYDALSGKLDKNDPLLSVSLTLAGKMLILSNLAGDMADAKAKLIRALESGEGLNKLKLMLSAMGGDSRDVVAKANAGDIDAVEALEAFGHRAAMFIGGYNTLVGGADAIVMAGGIGENAAELREQIVKRLGALGVKLDKKANLKVRFGASGVISTKDSKIPVVVIPTNEELMIARETVAVLSK